MKRKIKVSHEVPPALLHLSKHFNDYDYCLPHLLDENEIYRDYFLEAKEEGRYIIMDNSLHELGHAYDTERLIYWIEELKPNEFIVPDVWENYKASVENAIIWRASALPEEVTKVAVVQATTLHEAFECYKEYKKLGYKKIAFSYGASYYNDVCTHPNLDVGKALGRVYTISTLHKAKAINDKDRIHLLGCSLPQEFIYYDGIPFIESLDTSNPVMAALEGIEYKDYGLLSKPTLNMNMVMEWENFEKTEYAIDKINLIEINVNKFKKINNL